MQATVERAPPLTFKAINSSAMLESGGGDGMLVIYSGLKISDADHQWIESVRRAHDPQHPMVAAHFTFVFPFEGTGADVAIEHAARVAAATSPIPFRLTKAASVKDAFGSATHLFLLPREGEEAMRNLHAQLYAGVLAQHRRTEIPFLPHVTVGAFEEAQEAARAADRLGGCDVAGELTDLRVAEFDGRSVVDLCELPLRG